MLNSDDKDRQNHILNNIEMIITPMTNAVGYYNHAREEYLS